MKFRNNGKVFNTMAEYGFDKFKTKIGGTKLGKKVNRKIDEVIGAAKEIKNAAAEVAEAAKTGFMEGVTIHDVTGTGHYYVDQDDRIEVEGTEVDDSDIDGI